MGYNLVYDLPEGIQEYILSLKYKSEQKDKQELYNRTSRNVLGHAIHLVYKNKNDISEKFNFSMIDVTPTMLHNTFPYKNPEYEHDIFQWSSFCLKVIVLDDKVQYKWKGSMQPKDNPMGGSQSERTKSIKYNDVKTWNKLITQ